MSFKLTEALGSKPIPKLLIQQAVPASIGILVMSLNILIDTIFVGQWIGSNAIAAINVVLPVSFFIAALGMSIGVGGASIISRALGEGMRSKAERTFANQITLTLLLTVFVVVFGLLYVNEILPLFGGKGSLFSLAKTEWIERFFILGTVLFSFSIFLLSLQTLFKRNIKVLGPVTPVGGFLLIVGWGLLLSKFLNFYIK